MQNGVCELVWVFKVLLKCLHLALSVCVQNKPKSGAVIFGSRGKECY